MWLIIGRLQTICDVGVLTAGFRVLGFLKKYRNAVKMGGFGVSGGVGSEF